MAEAMVAMAGPTAPTSVVKSTAVDGAVKGAEANAPDGSGLLDEDGAGDFNAGAGSLLLALLLLREATLFSGSGGTGASLGEEVIAPGGDYGELSRKLVQGSGKFTFAPGQIRQKHFGAGPAETVLRAETVLGFEGRFEIGKGSDGFAELGLSGPHGLGFKI
jgi:hypothetical protein